MNMQQTVLIAAMVSVFIPLAAVFFRGRSDRIVMVAMALVAIAVTLHLITTLRLVQIGPRPSPIAWVYLLVASAVPVLLAGYMLSVCFGRDHPGKSFRDSRRVFALLGLMGVAFLFLLRHPAFVTGYDWADGRGTVRFGYLGKAYLVYVVVGIVLVGHNLEKTYRASASDVRPRLRLPLFGFFGVLGFFTFALATGMLYSSIGMGKLIAAALPIGFASVVVAHGYLRGAIADVSAPVSRNVVYTSFTALAAGLFVLCIGAAAQLAALTHWSPDEILIVALGFLTVLIGILLLVSNRFKRFVQRYIDRNFYVNRYDYRTQWTRLTECLENAVDQESLLDRVTQFLKEVFAADDVTIALVDGATRSIRPICGKGAAPPLEALEPEAPLFEQLRRGRRALLLDRSPHDFTYICIYAENQGWLDSTASRLLAPLLDGAELIGTIGLERRNDDDRFTFEDVALLDSISAHVGATLRSLRLVRELAEARETELVSQWSSMLLHDLKNYLAPLRMVATNLVESKDDPDIATICAGDISRVTSRMEHLVHTLSELRGNAELRMRAVCPNSLVRDTLAEMQIDRRPTIKLELRLDAEQQIRGDADMLRRVLENLITNAIDAMDGDGTLSICTQDHPDGGLPQVRIGVSDTGKGIPEDFLREKLFRPFATTKKKGLGLGLYQSRSIVHAHGGELTVKSERGKGSVFQVALKAVPSVTGKVGV